MKNNNKPQQKAITAEDIQKEEILSGIVDTELRKYTFKKEYEFFGKVLQGTFEAKYMSVTDRIKIGVLRSKLLDGADNVDPLTDDIVFMISYLQVALTKVPRWWNYDQLSLDGDLEKLREVYNEVYNFNTSFREYYAKNSNAGDSSDASSQEIMEN